MLLDECPKMEEGQLGGFTIAELLPPEIEQENMRYVMQGFWDGLRPVPRVSVSGWADKYRFLSSIAAAEAGRYRTSRTPYLRRIMDCLGNHEPYQRVVFMKAA